mgnify:CR=1 FL=1
MYLLDRIRTAISSHLPAAVLASVLIALADSYTGEISALLPLFASFLLHIVAIILGFVIIDVLWHRAFNNI